MFTMPDSDGSNVNLKFFNVSSVNNVVDVDVVDMIQTMPESEVNDEGLIVLNQFKPK